MTLEPADLGARFTLKGVLGEGGQGLVLEVVDAAAGRPQALKVLRPELAADAAKRLAFREEYLAHRALVHPRTVQVHDFGQLPCGLPFYTMDLVPGPGLDERFPLPLGEVRRRLIEALEGLAFLHGRGMLHGDLKPANLRVGADAELVIMDFGLLAPVGSRFEDPRGTLLYLAPEAARGDRLDPRADLYALGAVFYHLLAGRPPFDAADARTLLRAHLHEPPIPLSQLVPESYGDLLELVMTMLAKDPADRPASAAHALAVLGVEAGAQTTLMTPAFVGRADELERLLALVSEAGLAGRPAALAITGPAGVGKSALLDALRARLLRDGRAALWSAATGQDVPYGAMAAIARRLLVEAAANGFELDPEREAALLGDPGELDPGAAASRTRAAWVSLLEAQPLDGPLVWLLDDWHLADEASTSLVRGLVNGRAGTLAVLAAGGAGEGWFPAPDARLVLEGLEPASLGRLVAGALGLREAPVGFVSDLQALTGGVPARALGALANALARGGLPHDGDRWRLDRAQLTPADLPADELVLARQRLADLVPSALRLSLGLALCARPVSLARLGAWLGVDEETLANAAALLRQRGMLIGDAEQARLDRLAAAAVTLEATPELQAATHRQLAVGMASEPSASEAELARHWLGAGEAERAVTPALLAAAALVRRFCLGEAEALVTPLLELPGLADADRSKALELAGDLARMRGDLAEAGRLFGLALAIAPVASRPHLQTNLAIIAQTQGQFGEAQALAEAAADAAATNGDLAEQARALTTLARILALAGDAGRAPEVADEALSAARQAGSRPLEGEALALKGYFLSAQPEREAEAVACLEESLTLRQALGDPMALNDTYNLLGNMHMARGRLAPAMAAFQESAALCRLSGVGTDDEATALINQAQVGLELGELDAALGAAEAAATLARASGAEFLRAYASALWAGLLARRGRLGDAEPLISEALASAISSKNPYLEAVARTHHAAVSLAAGDIDAARIHAEAGLEAAELSCIDEISVPLAVQAAQACLGTGDLTAAQGHARFAADLAATKASGTDLAKAALAGALMAWASGDAAGAERSLDELRHHAEPGPMKPLLAEADILGARICTLEGRALEAVRLARRALEGAQQMGLPLLESEAAHALAVADPTAGEDSRRVADRLRVLADAWPAAMRAAFLSRWLPEPVQPVATVLPPELASLTLGELVARAAQPSPQAGMERVVADFGRMVMGTLQYEEVLDRVIEQVMRITGADRGMIMLVDAEGALTGLVSRPVADAGEGGVVNFSRTFVRAAIEDRQSIWVADARNDERFAAAQSVVALDLRTLICVPLLAGGEVLGALYLDQKSVNRAFDEADLRLVEGLAGFAAMAIANARRFEEAQRQARVMMAVRQLGGLLAAPLDRERAAATVLSECLRVAGAARGVLLLDDPPVVALARDADGRPANAEYDAERVAEVTRTGQPLVVPASVDGTESALVLPLVADRFLVGVVYVAAGSECRIFTPQDLEPLEPVTSQAACVLYHLSFREAQALKLARLEKALALQTDQREASNVDGATGLFGPTYFMTQLADEVAQADRYRGPLSMLVARLPQLDRLQAIAGPAMIQALLAGVGEDLRGLARRTDVPARLNADEVAVLMPHTPLEGARQFAGRLREHLAAWRVDDATGGPGWALEPHVAVVAWQGLEDAAGFLERALRQLPEAGG